MLYTLFDGVILRFPSARPVHGFLEAGTGLPETLLSHLFFLATDPGGNSWCKHSPCAQGFSTVCGTSGQLPMEFKHQEIQLIPHPSLRPGLDWVHIYLLSHRFIHSFIYPSRDSFIHSFYMPNVGQAQGDPERQALQKFQIW